MSIRPASGMLYFTTEMPASIVCGARGVDINGQKRRRRRNAFCIGLADQLFKVEPFWLELIVGSDPS